MTTSPKKRKEVLSYFTSDLTIDKVADIMGVSIGTVRNIWVAAHGVDECAARKKRLSSGANHPKWKDGVTMSRGYRLIRAPSWYTGCKDEYNRAPEHMVNWCLYNDRTEVPEGHIVHHRNENKVDNSKENLELLSKSEHTATHAARRSRDWNGRFI